MGIVVGLIVHASFSFFATPAADSEENRPRQPQPGKRPQHPDELAGHFVGVVGVIYAVLVAFVVVTAWQSRDHAQDITLQEQSNVNDLFHLYEAYHNSDALAVRFMLRDYSIFTWSEWTQMKSGQDLCPIESESNLACSLTQGAVSRRTNDLAHCIRMVAASLQPSTYQEQVLYQEGLRIIQNLARDRGERRLRYRERTLKPILWLAFLLGALILVAMTYWVPEQESIGQLVRTTALFAMVGLMLALAFVFDRPFSGVLQIRGDAWTVIAQHFDHDLRDTQKPYDGQLPAQCTKDTQARNLNLLRHGEPSLKPS